MKPRELDVLIAEKVMDTLIKFYGMGILGVEGVEREFLIKDAIPFIPHYSTDIAAVWTVVEKIDLLRERVLVYGNPWRSFSEMKWYVIEPPIFDSDQLVLSEQDTAPLAICMAALKVMGIEI